MDELTRHRWNKVGDPNKHEPETALNVALAQNAEQPYHHVIIAFCYKKPDGTFGVGYKQAGQLDTVFGSVGLLTQVSALMVDE